MTEDTALQPVPLQALEGNLTVRVAGHEFELVPGSLHIEPQAAHSIMASERARLQLTVPMIDSPGESQVPLAD
jgi:quercetin dioxygenase-like cupin family protein